MPSELGLENVFDDQYFNDIFVTKLDPASFDLTLSFFLSISVS